jgi:hypothetical protein
MWIVSGVTIHPLALTVPGADSPSVGPATDYLDLTIAFAWELVPDRQAKLIFPLLLSLHHRIVALLFTINWLVG